MKNGVDTLENILGNDVFRKYVNVLLTDRGSEFYAAKDMETGVMVPHVPAYFIATQCNPGKKVL